MKCNLDESLVESKQKWSYLGPGLGTVCGHVRDRQGHGERNTVWDTGGFVTYNLSCQPTLAPISSECIKRAVGLLRSLSKPGPASCLRVHRQCKADNSHFGNLTFIFIDCPFDCLCFNCTFNVSLIYVTHFELPCVWIELYK